MALNPDPKHSTGMQMTLGYTYMTSGYTCMHASLDSLMSRTR